MIAGSLAVSGAALITACGGETNSTRTSSSELVPRSEDTSKQAKPGGVFKDRHDDVIQTFDPFFTSKPSQVPTNMAYQRLLTTRPGYLQPAGLDLDADLAESWELSPDKLTLTLKLHTNDHWSP